MEHGQSAPEIDVSIRENATSILLWLAQFQKSEREAGRETGALRGETIAEGIALNPADVSAAIDFLHNSGYVEAWKAFGTKPFSFAALTLTSRGEYEAERLAALRDAAKMTDVAADEDSEWEFRRAGSGVSRSRTRPTDVPEVQAPPAPVGSPYGFTASDWASVSFDRSDRSRLIVCLGFAWECRFYDSGQLEKNIRKVFRAGLKKATAPYATSIKLDFRKLQGGYGGHLFNEIARDIISSDVAVFDASAQSPNVMIELGVALTWGTSVLLIRHRDSDKPPSDISGQTWAEYTTDASSWSDANHREKLSKLIELVLRRKGALSV